MDFRPHGKFASKTHLKERIKQQKNERRRGNPIEIPSENNSTSYTNNSPNRRKQGRPSNNTSNHVNLHRDDGDEDDARFSDSEFNPEKKFDGMDVGVCNDPKRKAYNKKLLEQFDGNIENQQLQQKPQRRRAKGHETNSLLVAGSPQRSRSKSPFGSASLSPLEDALDQQQTNRKRGKSYTQQMGNVMNQLTCARFGKGSTETRRHKMQQQDTTKHHLKAKSFHNVNERSKHVLKSSSSPSSPKKKSREVVELDTTVESIRGGDDFDEKESKRRKRLSNVFGDRKKPTPNKHDNRQQQQQNEEEDVIHIDDSMHVETDSFSVQGHNDDSGLDGVTTSPKRTPQSRGRRGNNHSNSSNASNGNYSDDDDGTDILAAVQSCEKPVNADDYKTNKHGSSNKNQSTLDIAHCEDRSPGTTNWLKVPKVNHKLPDSGGRNFGVKNSGSKRTKSYGSFDSGSFRKTNNHDEIESDSSYNSRAASGRNANRPNRQNQRDSNTSKRNNDDDFFPNKSHRSNETAHRLKKSGMSVATNMAPLGDDDCWKTDGSLKDIEQAKNKKLTDRPKTRRGPLTQSTINYRSQRRTRSVPRVGGNTDNAITIDDSSSEEEEVMSDDEPSLDLNSPEGKDSVDITEKVVEELRPMKTRAAGDLATIDAARIAVGKKVFKSKCQLSLQPGTKHPYIRFSFSDSASNKVFHHKCLIDDALKEVKYFISDDENGDIGIDDIDDSMTIIAFRIIPNSKNEFDKYKNSYEQDETESEEDSEKRYISVEVRDADEFQHMLEQMRQHPILDIFLSPEARIEHYELKKFNSALAKDSRNEQLKRLGSARRTRSGGTKKTTDADNALLLVFPFDVKEEVLIEATSDLHELRGDHLGVDVSSSVSSELGEFLQTKNLDSEVGKASTRTHYVTIRQDDRERLLPTQFLNDSLVDLWMRWISRGESQSHSSLHFFTSHFMTTLKYDGAKAVSSWTSKKNINIFGKKFIFLPVNADLHWSLCVVVNAGLIGSAMQSSANEQWDTHDVPCLLFFDSLKMHQKQKVAANIRNWLNYEWNRVKKGRDEKNPFDKTSMPLVTPKIPYQDNSCDCGVFVCRYAYSLYLLRNHSFTRSDLADKFKTLITNNPAFQFDMDDIARIRREMMTLVDRLSEKYTLCKQREKAAAKRSKLRQMAKLGDKDSVSSDHISGVGDAIVTSSDANDEEMEHAPSFEGKDDKKMNISSAEEEDEAKEIASSSDDSSKKKNKCMSTDETGRVEYSSHDTTVDIEFDHNCSHETSL